MDTYRTVTFLPESGPPHEVGALVSRDGRVEMVLNRSAAHVEGLSRYDVLTRRAGVRRLEGAVDLDAHGSCDPNSFVELVERVAVEAARGRTVELLNIPPHLRLHLEITGRGHLLPMRPRSGPRLPEVLMELWSQG